LVFGTSPTLTTPVIGSATGTSLGLTVSSGTTVPLTIQNNGTGNSFVVNDVASDTTPFIVDAAGNVGVSTSAPSTALDVTGLTRSFGYSVSGTGVTGGTAAFAAGTISTDTNWGMYFRPPTGSAGTALYSFRNAADVEQVRIDANGITTINAIADATTTTAARGGGYMGVPPSAAAATGAYTIVAADAGEHIYSTGTRTITIPANGSVAFPLGTAITFIAATGATVTIAITTDTLLLAGAGTTGSRTLAPFGMATAIKITSTSWIISGNGLS
jgi:hypothetical protein